MLTRDSKDPIQVFSDALHRVDNDHKPGGRRPQRRIRLRMVCRCVSAVAVLVQGAGKTPMSFTDTGTTVSLDPKLAGSDSAAQNSRRPAKAHVGLPRGITEGMR